MVYVAMMINPHVLLEIIQYWDSTCFVCPTMGHLISGYLHVIFSL